MAAQKKGGRTMDAKHLAETIHREAEYIKELAAENLVCKRKAVGCAILEVHDMHIVKFFATNGPSHPKNECTNEKGNCGCAHAEPRAIMKYLEGTPKHCLSANNIIVTTYSPCTPCVNMIIDSGLFGLAVYEILAPHWARATVMLKNVMPVLELNDVTAGRLDFLCTK